MLREHPEIPIKQNAWMNGLSCHIWIEGDIKVCLHKKR
jgi:hypothetical protein